MGRYLRWIGGSTLLVAVLTLLAACGGAESAAPAGSKAGATTGAAADGPRIAVDEESFDFGKVPLDKVVSHAFRISNVGNAPLVLNGEPPVRAAQGC